MSLIYLIWSASSAITSLPPSLWQLAWAVAQVAIGVFTPSYTGSTAFWKGMGYFCYVADHYTYCITFIRSKIEIMFIVGLPTQNDFVSREWSSFTQNHEQIRKSQWDNLQHGRTLTSKTLISNNDFEKKSDRETTRNTLACVHFYGMTKKFNKIHKVIFQLIHDSLQVSQSEQKNQLTLKRNIARMSSSLSVVFCIQLYRQHPQSIDK